MPSGWSAAATPALAPSNSGMPRPPEPNEASGPPSRLKRIASIDGALSVALLPATTIFPSARTSTLAAWSLPPVS